MTSSDSAPAPSSRPRTRHDGWTPERQIGFLGALDATRSVTRAAATVGMSRESAYRLRCRANAALFALLWDRALAPANRQSCESHTRALTDGRLARILGSVFRGKMPISSDSIRAGLGA